MDKKKVEAKEVQKKCRKVKRKKRKALAEWVSEDRREKHLNREREREDKHQRLEIIQQLTSWFTIP